MTDANIGPIKIPVAHLQDINNRFVSNKEIKETENILSTEKVTESEEFAVVLENYLVKQFHTFFEKKEKFGFLYIKLAQFRFLININKNWN